MKETETLLDQPIGLIAAEDMKKALIFQKMGLDFCCGGRKTIREACQTVGVNPDDVNRELLQQEMDTNACSIPPNKMSDAMLIQYIEDVHHRYVREQIPIINTLLEKTSLAHGSMNPELFRINHCFIELSVELLQHMEKEEKVLFPAIIRLNSAEEQPLMRNLKQPVAMMEHEHESAGELLREMRSLSGNYTPPKTACNTFKLLYNQLEAFEKDLHIHIHLENNVLFPRVTEK